MKKALSDPERRKLLEDLSELPTDADAVKDDPKWFLPLRTHERALRPETLVVRGERGVGKTALFHFLQHLRARGPQLSSVFPIIQQSSSQWIEGFSEGIEHPSPLTLDKFIKTATNEELRLFWFAHLCCRLSSSGTELPALPSDKFQATWSTRLNEPVAWVPEAGHILGALSAWLDEVERKSTNEVVVTYDHLDKIGIHDPESRRRFTGSLLALWLSLTNRYRRIRAKIFVREDLFQAAQSAFPDASKLDPRSVSLDWDVESLYRLLIKHMANRSEELRDWTDSGVNRVPLHHLPGLEWMPPDTLPAEGRPSQKAFVDHLAGPTMGKGEKKGYTHRWIPNRLQDARVRIVPRSMLTLIRNAAEYACRNGPGAAYRRLLTPLELQAALEPTSKRRTVELQEEHPVIARLESLRDLTVMLRRAEAVKRLRKPVGADDGFGDDGERVLQELLHIGALDERSDGRIDVPDIYRYYFGIKRKGGVAHPR